MTTYGVDETVECDVAVAAVSRGRVNGGPPDFALPGDRPHFAPDRPADVRALQIDVTLDFERHTVSGTVTTEFSALFEQLREITFDAAELQIERVGLTGGTPNLDYWSDGETLHVRLDRTYAYGETFRVEVQYHAQPRDGLHFIGPDEGNPERPVQAWTQGQPEYNHYWFPCHDFPNDRATTAVNATVPANFFALSNGRLDGVDEHPSTHTRTFRWRLETPHPAYLVTLVVGEFTRIPDRWRDIPVDYYVRPGREQDAPYMLDKTPAMMEFYSQHFGVDYAYPKYAQIVPELFTGAMENTSATTHTYRLLPDQRARLDYSPHRTVAHELVHQWFGDLLTCRDWGHIWLNETFATYFEMTWTQHDEGEDDYRVEVQENLRAYLAADKVGRRPIVYNVYRKDGGELFDRHVYQKGSTVLHLLRWVLGEEPFWRSIQAYAKRNRGREVITADLERAIEETTGRSMARFFAEWVYGAGHPEFAVNYSWDDEHKLAKVRVEQRQARDGGNVFHTPVELLFAVPRAEGNQGSGAQAELISYRVELDEPDQTFFVPLARRPLMVRFDPGSRIPKTLKFDRPAELLRYQLRNDTDVLGRIEAAELLGEAGDGASIEALGRALKDESFWAARRAIAQALGAQRTERALNALLDGLKQVSEPKARRAIVTALGQFRAPEQPELAQRAADALDQLLRQGEPSYYVEESAATALGRTRTSGAFDRLMPLLERTSWLDVIRAGVFQGLGELAEPRAADVLSSWMLNRRNSMDVRAGAAAGLRTLAGTKRLEPGEARTRAVDALIAALSDPWQLTTMAALGALEAFGDPRAIHPIERYIAGTVNSRGIRVARQALQSIRRGTTRDEDARNLRTEVDEVREESRRLRERLAALEAQTAGGRGDNGGA